MKPEAALHRATANFLRAALKPPTVWSTVPSGGGGRVRGAQLKAMGLAKGLPDILVVHPALSPGYSLVVGLELKARRGRLSPEQVAMQAAFGRAGGWYFVCRSLEDVEAALWEAQVPLHASVMGRAA